MSKLLPSAFVLPLILFSSTSSLAQTFRNLGPQISATTLQGSTFTKDPKGNVLACTVLRGVPAKLVVFDITKPDPILVLPLKGAEGAWNATTASDGSVYAGTDPNGHLYRYIPGEDTIHDLGQVPGDTWVWNVMPGKDGEIFAATYPGCRIVRYHPRDGFKDLSRGPLVEKENYARAVAYDPKRNKIFAGVGSHAHLIEFDPATGAKTEFLPKQYADQEFVYGVRVANDHLYANVTNANKCLVYNLVTRKFEDTLDGPGGQLVLTQSPTDNRVFYSNGNNIFAYDPTKKDAPEKLFTCPSARAITFLDDNTLAAFTYRAQLVRCNTATRDHTSTTLNAPSEPVPIQSICLGPDNRIWTGGYLSGGNAAYDPETNRSEQYKGLSQAESMVTLDKTLYLGIYPHARFYAYDSTKPWNGKSNPHHLGDIENQSRPMTALAVKDLNQIFFGTIPEYGLLGGGIAVIDCATDKLSFHHDIIPNQSITALAYSDGVIIAGTSIWGGLGIQPSEKEAKLFVWDPRDNKKAFETVPVPHAAIISKLIVGPDKKIWGFADGTLFVFDPAARKIVSRDELFPPDKTKASKWRGAFFVLHPNGNIYGTLANKLFRLDPATKKLTILREQESDLLTVDNNGHLYFRDRINLWQFTP